MHNARERAHARSKPKAKKQAKGRPVVINYIIRASTLYVRATKGRSYHRAWRRRVMRSVKKKVCPSAYNTHKKRVLQAVSTGFMSAFAYKASAGRKIFIMRKGMCV